MHALKIKLVYLQPVKGNELAERIMRTCNFCTKLVETQKINEKLSGSKAFYCTFCLRHNYTINSKNILPFSFRSIIGYYYQEFYIEQRKMWLSEIEDYVQEHKCVGLLNPLFNYDDESMIWFVDFSRVGNTSKKIKLDEVLETITNILACFNMTAKLPDARLDKFYSKFKTALVTYYKQRHKPDLLVPTLQDCLVREKNLEKTKNFCWNSVKIH
jgi:hypothetical protein